MKPEEPQVDVPEEDLAEALADWDQRLGASGETLPAVENGVAPEVTPRLAASSAERLARDMDCVRLLREVWKPGESGTLGPPAQSGISLAEAAAGSRPSDLPQRIGRFEIRRELGCGGYGVVFLAYDPQLHREVALKVPRGEALLTADLRARFRHEARAAAALDHPHIVPVYDAGEVGPICYIASAYCPGDTLAQWHAKQIAPVPCDDAAGLVATLADAVAHAHSRGILHRDLKPANVLLGGFRVQGSGVGDGDANQSNEQQGSILNPEPARLSSPQARTLNPKITDFGLARVLSDGDANLTRTGAVLGTPQYMAPEQAAGRTQDIGTAADIYALGAILYELLTGQPPFRAETPLATLRKVEFDEPPPPSRLRPKLPRDLETIVLKCLRKEPQRRYLTARDLADDLRRFLAGAPVEARPVGNFERCQRWCWRNPWIAGLAAAVMLLAIAGLIGTTRYVIDVTAARDDAQKNADENRRSLVALNVATATRLMREGDFIGSLVWYAQAWQLDHDDPWHDALHRERFSAILRQSPKILQQWEHGEELSWVEFSPDGRFIVTAAYDHKARVFDVESGAKVCELAHGDRVERAYFSKDGSRFLTASHDGTARIADTLTGQQFAELPHAEAVYDAQFSPDDSLVATCSADQTAALWDANTGRKLLEVKHGGKVISVHFSPDGKKFVTASHDRTARVWNVTDGKPLTDPLVHREKLTTAVFSPDGRRILTGSGLTHIERNVRGEARLWNAVTGQREGPKVAHLDSLWMAKFSPDGRYIVTTSRDSTCRVWDASSGGAVVILRHADAVSGAWFSRDGRRLLTTSLDCTARVWDPTTGAPLSPVLRHADHVFSAAFSPDGSKIVTASKDQTVRLWQLADNEKSVLSLTHGNIIHAAALDPAGTRIVTASEDRTAKVWSLADGAATASLDAHDGSVLDASFSADGRWVATASWDGKARLWDAKTGTLIRTIPHNSPVIGVSIDATGDRLLTVCREDTAQIWDLRDETAAPVSFRHGGRLNRGALSPNGRLVVTAGADGQARIWDAATGAVVGAPLDHPCSVLDVEFNRDGSRIATACGDNLHFKHRHARVWNSHTGAPVTPPLRHIDGVFRARFSPDGKTVATASEDWSARIWSADDGSPITPPLQHGDQVYAICFSRDGQRVATGCRDGKVRVWDAVSGQPLGPPLEHGSPVWGLSFLADGQRLVSFSPNSRTARIWSRGLDPRPREELERYARFLAGHQIDTTGSLAPLSVGDLPTIWRTLQAKEAQLTTPQ